MEKKTAADVLIEMAEAKNIQISTTAKIRNQFQNIEKARAAGAKLSDIVSALKIDGLQISKQALSVMLCRIRAERNLPKNKISKGVHSPVDTPESSASVSSNIAANKKPGAESKEASINKTTLPGFKKATPKRPKD